MLTLVPTAHCEFEFHNGQICLQLHHREYGYDYTMYAYSGFNTSIIATGIEMSLFNPFDVLDDAKGAALSRVPATLRAALLKAQKADASTRARGLADAARWLSDSSEDAPWDACVLAASRAFIACASDDERAVREAAAELVAALTARDRRWAAAVGPDVLWAWAAMAEKPAVAAFAEAFPRHRWPAVAKVLGNHAKSVTLESATAAQTVAALAFVAREAPEAALWVRFADATLVRGERTVSGLCSVLLSAVRSGNLNVHQVVVCASDAVSIPAAIELVELGASVADIGKLSAALAAALPTLSTAGLQALPRLQKVIPSLPEVIRAHIRSARTLDAGRAIALWRTLSTIGCERGDVSLLASTSSDVAVLSGALSSLESQTWFAEAFEDTLARCSTRAALLAAHPASIAAHLVGLTDDERASLVALLVSRGAACDAALVLNSTESHWSDSLVSAAATAINRGALSVDKSVSRARIDSCAHRVDSADSLTASDEQLDASTPTLQDPLPSRPAVNVTRLDVDTRLRLCAVCNVHADEAVVTAALDALHATFSIAESPSMGTTVGPSGLLHVFLKALGAQDHVLRLLMEIESEAIRDMFHSLHDELVASLDGAVPRCLFPLAALAEADVQCHDADATGLCDAFSRHPEAVSSVVSHLPHTWSKAFPSSLWESAAEYARRAPCLAWSHVLLCDGSPAIQKPDGADALLIAAEGIERDLPAGDDAVLTAALVIAALSLGDGAAPLCDSFWRALTRRVDTDAAAEGLIAGRPVLPTGGLFWLVSARLLADRAFSLPEAVTSAMPIEALSTHALCFAEVDVDSVPVTRLAAANVSWPRDAACMILVRLDSTVAPSAAARFLSCAVGVVRPEVWQNEDASSLLRAHALPADAAGVALGRACVSAGLSAYVNASAAWDAMVRTRRPDVSALVDDLAAAGVSFDAESAAVLFATARGHRLSVESCGMERLHSDLPDSCLGSCHGGDDCSSKCNLLDSRSASVNGDANMDSVQPDTEDALDCIDSASRLKSLQLSEQHHTALADESHVLLAARRVLVSRADSVLERVRLSEDEATLDVLLPWKPVANALLRGCPAALDVFLSLAEGAEDPRAHGAYGAAFRERIAPLLLAGLADAAPWASLSVLSTGGDAAIPRLPHLAQLLVRVFKRFPAGVRAWLAAQRPGRVSTLRTLVAKHLSAFMVDRELLRARAYAAALPKADALSVRVEATAAKKAVSVSYSVEDASAVSLSVVVPRDFPLVPARAEGVERLGVSEGKWRAWLLTVSSLLSSSDAPVVHSIRRWREDVERSMAGIEACAVCYCVLHASDRSLPGPACATCNHRFHAACLYRWFKSSGGATCPMCRALF